MGSQIPFTHTLVFGLGETGYAVAKYLLQQGQTIAIADTRPNPPFLQHLTQLEPSLQLFDPNQAPEVMLCSRQIVLSPGIDPYSRLFNDVRRHKIPLISDIELFCQHAPAPIIAITGTNGKSTVTQLTAEILTEAGITAYAGGNLSPAAMELLQRRRPDFYVLEVSSFQLQTTYSLSPYSAALLNISPDHLDRHKTMADYIATKELIYNGCANPVQNKRLLDNEPLQGATLFSTDTPQKDEFGLLYHKGQYHFAHGAHAFLPVTDCPLAGEHQWANILASCALSYLAGASYKAMANAIKGFKGLNHRLKEVAQIDHVRWFNDSKATNPGALQAAIEGLGPNIDGELVLVLGGQAKDPDFSGLSPLLRQYVRSAVVFGQDGPTIGSTINNATPVISAGSLQQAVISADQIATPGDVVLFAPACASFDMFTDFIDRGEQFERLVDHVKRGNYCAPKTR